MKKSEKILIGITLISLAACSSQQVKEEAKVTKAAGEPPVLVNDALQASGQNPPMTVVKGDKTLNLVRLMDGGICKNPLEGTKGSFLVYADPEDIKRIKRDKGEQIFSDFEAKIQHLASEALGEAVEKTNLSEDPFALGNDEAQEKLAKQLSGSFHEAIAEPINAFQKETSLTIDVVAYPPSFIFFQKGCDTSYLEQESQDSESPIK
ncbi:MAG: hypothetical protein ACXWT3_13760 [Methylococcaceae bacterium]